MFYSYVSILINTKLVGHRSIFIDLYTSMYISLSYMYLV